MPSFARYGMRPDKKIGGGEKGGHAGQESVWLILHYRKVRKKKGTAHRG